jgi:hypothetical protein
MENKENELDCVNYNVNTDNDKYLLSFFSSRFKNNKYKTINKLSLDNFDKTLKYYFPITNKTEDNNYYTFHGKTMSKLKKFGKVDGNKTFLINKITYNKNRKNYNNINLPKVNLLHDSKNYKIISLNKNSKNKFENKRYMGPKTKPKREKNYFPSFNYLNPEMKEDYFSLIKKSNQSLLFIKDKELDIDNEIENLNCSNYITNHSIRSNNEINSNNNLIYSDDKRNLETQFLEKSVTFGNFKNVHFYFKNPVQKAKVHNLLENFNRMSSIHRLKYYP